MWTPAQLCAHRRVVTGHSHHHYTHPLRPLRQPTPPAPASRALFHSHRHLPPSTHPPSLPPPPPRLLAPSPAYSLVCSRSLPCCLTLSLLLAVFRPRFPSYSHYLSLSRSPCVLSFARALLRVLGHPYVPLFFARHALPIAFSFLTRLFSPVTTHLLLLFCSRLSMRAGFVCWASRGVEWWLISFSALVLSLGCPLSVALVSLSLFSPSPALRGRPSFYRSICFVGSLSSPFRV